MDSDNLIKELLSEPKENEDTPLLEKPQATLIQTSPNSAENPIPAKEEINFQTGPTHEKTNKPWKIVFFFAIGVIVFWFGLSLYYYLDKVGNPFDSDISVVYVFTIVLPVIYIGWFYLYFMFLVKFRFSILKIYIIINISSVAVLITLGFIYWNWWLITTGMIIGFIFPLYLFCLSEMFKLSLINVSTALTSFKYLKKGIFSKILKFLILLSIMLGMFCLGILQFNSIFVVIEDENGKRNQDLSDTEKGLIVSCFVLSIISLVYISEVLNGVSFMFGASMCDQISKFKFEHKDQGYEIPTETAVQITENANNIAFNTQFGNACLGALLLTIIKLIRFMIYRKSREQKSCCACLMLCIAKCLEEMVEFLTSQAYVHSAIYGKSLIESGKMAKESFKTVGLEKFFSFELSETLLNIMAFIFSVSIALIVGYISLLFGGGVFYDDDVENSSRDVISLSITMLHFLALFLIGRSLNGLVGGHAACQISIYVEDPERSSATHELYKEMREILEYDF
eukprot:GAHX01001949.1.p1 GENE.GAHX01001949.1~~GAHX01001949.1.p1  ORF type:complete len:511 (+),score=69.34 GAHX01001949.1:1241-2773(+)